MAQMVNRICKYCKGDFPCRVVDVKRGWGMFCHKSCKAKWQAVHGARSKKARIAYTQAKNSANVQATHAAHGRDASFAEYDEIVAAEEAMQDEEF